MGARDAVATHGALAARRRRQRRRVPSARLKRPVLLDVNPATLAIHTAGGFTERLLDKNSPIPIERTRVFTTARDNQTRVEIDCCRGEDRRYYENEPLGTLVLDELAAKPRGELKIEVSFRVDADGILHVRASDPSPGARQEAHLHVLGAPTADGAGDEVVSVRAEVLLWAQRVVASEATPAHELLEMRAPKPTSRGSRRRSTRSRGWRIPICIATTLTAEEIELVTTAYSRVAERLRRAAHAADEDHADPADQARPGDDDGVDQTEPESVRRSAPLAAPHGRLGRRDVVEGAGLLSQGRAGAAARRSHGRRAAAQDGDRGRSAVDVPANGARRGRGRSCANS